MTAPRPEYVPFATRLDEYRSAVARSVNDRNLINTALQISATHEADDPSVRAALHDLYDEARQHAETPYSRYSTVSVAGMDSAEQLQVDSYRVNFARWSARQAYEMRLGVAAGAAGLGGDSAAADLLAGAGGLSRVLSSVLRYRDGPGDGLDEYDDGAWSDFEPALENWLQRQGQVIGAYNGLDVDKVSAYFHVLSSVLRRPGDQAIITRLEREIARGEEDVDAILRSHPAEAEMARQAYGMSAPPSGIPDIDEFRSSLEELAATVPEPPRDERTTKLGAVAAYLRGPAPMDAIKLHDHTSLIDFLSACTSGAVTRRRSGGPTRNESEQQIGDLLSHSDPELLRSPVDLYGKVADAFDNPGDGLLGLLDKAPVLGGLLGAVTGVAKAGGLFLKSIFDGEAREDAARKLAIELVDGFLDAGLELTPVAKFSDLGQMVGGVLVKVAEFTDIELAETMGEGLLKLDLDEWTDRFSESLVDSLVEPGTATAVQEGRQSIF